MRRSPQSFRGWMRAYLELMRPANMVTSAADSLAGYAASGSPLDARLFLVMGASLALYGGGVVFNDIFDRRLDAAERPERPLPSGRAQLKPAAALGVLLLLSGTVLAFLVSVPGGLLACAIATAALAYDARAKHHNELGPAVLGLARALNFLLGLSVAPAAWIERWPLALLSLAYVASITALSSGEVHGGSLRRGLVSAALMASVLVVLAALVAASGQNAAFGALALAFLAARIAPPYWRACRFPDPIHIRAAVRAAVLSLVILDACIAAVFGGAFYCAAALALMPAAALLARVFPVT